MAQPHSTGSSPDTYWETLATVSQDSEEVWNMFCFEMGALGAEVVQENQDTVQVRHFFQTAPFPDEVAALAQFRLAYPQGEPPLEVRLGEQPMQPWETAWRDHFTPIMVGKRLCVRPPWHDASPDTSSRVDVVINPGQGFGTGWHPSTHLALLSLEALLTGIAPPRSLLDVGTGSGILAIAGRLLGVPTAHAIDVDERVLAEVQANFALSGLSTPEFLVVGTPESVSGHYPLVIANITAPVLLAHREDLARLTEAEGWLIVSGVLEAEQATVREAFAALGLYLEAEGRREGWWSATLHHAPARNP